MKNKNQIKLEFIYLISDHNKWEMFMIDIGILEKLFSPLLQTMKTVPIIHGIREQTYIGAAIKWCTQRSKPLLSS